MNVRGRMGDPERYRVAWIRFRGSGHRRVRYVRHLPRMRHVPPRPCPWCFDPRGPCGMCKDGEGVRLFPTMVGCVVCGRLKCPNARHP